MNRLIKILVSQKPYISSRRTHEYLSFSRSLVGKRELGCWCQLCYESVRSAGTALPAPGCGRRMFGWTEQTVHQINQRAVQSTRAGAQAQGKADALRLKPGQFLAAQVRTRKGTGRTCSRATRGQDGMWAGEAAYWIGRGAPGGRRDGTCIIKDDFTSARETFEGPLFSQGDVAIAVEWFALHPSDEEGMHYVLWDHVADGNAVDT